MKNSRLFTRLLAALLTLFVFAGITAVPAFAGEEPKPSTYTITLKKNGDTTEIQNDWAGMTATAYQVFSLASTADPTNKVYAVHDDFKAFFDIDTVKTAFTGKPDTPVYLGYDAAGNKLVAANTAIAGYIQITNNALLDKTYGESDLISRIGSNSVQLATFYSWIEQYIEKSTSLTQKPVTAAASSADTFTITVPADGYYALLFSNVPDGISVKQGILVTANSSIVVKAEDIPLTKTVQNQTETGSTKTDSSTASMGDTLAYEITTKVPTLTDYSNLTLFQLSDTMKNQQLNADSFSLKIGTSTFSFVKGTTSNVYTATDTSQSDAVIATLTIGEYTASDDGGSQSFTLFFGQHKSGADPDAIYDTSILEKYEGQTITLTYTATLTADAVTVNGNDVTLNYTNNGDTGKKEAHTDVYTYGIQVTKTFSDNSTTANYAAVKFQLYTDAEYQKGETTRAAMTLYQADDGTYKTTGNTATAELSLDATKGTLTVLGLKEGTYWLVETATAAEFNKSEDIKIILTAEKKPSGNPANLDKTNTKAEFKNSVTEITQTIKNCTDTSGTETVSISQLQFTVLNQKGFTLPQTGGAGTWMFTFGGIALIAAAGVLLAISCKKSKNK